MIAHVAAVIEVTDPDTFERYVARAAEALKKHDGRVAAVAAPEGETLEDTGAATGAILVLREI